MIILNIQIAFEKIMLVWRENVGTFILNIDNRIIDIKFLNPFKGILICFLVFGFQISEIETRYTRCVGLSWGCVIFFEFWLGLIWDRVEFATLYLKFAALFIYFTCWLFRWLAWYFWESSAVETQFGLWPTRWFALLRLHWIFSDWIIHDL